VDKWGGKPEPLGDSSDTLGVHALLFGDFLGSLAGWLDCAQKLRLKGASFPAPRGCVLAFTGARSSGGWVEQAPSVCPWRGWLSGWG